MLLAGIAWAGSAAAAVRDVPFQQAVSVQYPVHPELAGASLARLVVDSEGRVFVATDRGVARLLDGRLVLDRSYRPIAGKPVQDLGLQHGEVFYLFNDELLANAFAGRHLAALPPGRFRRFAVGSDFTALLAGPKELALLTAEGLKPVPFNVERTAERLAWHQDLFYLLAADQVFRLKPSGLERLHQGDGLTALAFRDQTLLLGSRRGYYGLDLETGRPTLPLQDRLPAVEITALAATTNGVWGGTPRGVFFRADTGAMRYFASRRCLADDTVLDLQPDARGDLHVLTRSGVTRIEFRSMTLAEKAAHFDRKIRERHIRYGFCAELRLRTPGDRATAEMIDTDNDGTWSSYYLASQVFRYAATGDLQARVNAWQTFEALERLQAIHSLEGFPARTFERTGFKLSDPERWRTAPDPRWEWKGHTSSDEITAQTFACAVLYELGTRDDAERSRIAAAYERIIQHILRNNLYLVDTDGQPTLWGRWNPEYVNAYPPTIGDRRLNSAEIVAFLQFAHRVTGKAEYRERGFELLQRHGYLRNITNSLAQIRATPGFVFRGHDMGDVWNHSDDLLAFVNYWTLHRCAFTEDLRRQYAASVKDHWQIEAVERNPLWSFVYAATGATQFDIEGVLWTLRQFPLDLVSWRIENSHRRDLELLPASFRNQQSRQLLPPDERPIMRWNGNPFVLDGGDGGQTELAGDEFLLPYWLGRYLRIIE